MAKVVVVSEYQLDRGRLTHGIRIGRWFPMSGTCCNSRRPSIIISHISSHSIHIILRHCIILRRTSGSHSVSLSFGYYWWQFRVENTGVSLHLLQWHGFSCLWKVQALLQPRQHLWASFCHFLLEHLAACDMSEGFEPKWLIVRLWQSFGEIVHVFDRFDGLEQGWALKVYDLLCLLHFFLDDGMLKQVL